MPTQELLGLAYYILRIYLLFLLSNKYLRNKTLLSHLYIYIPSTLKGLVNLLQRYKDFTYSLINKHFLSTSCMTDIEARHSQRELNLKIEKWFNLPLFCNIFFPIRKEIEWRAPQTLWSQVSIVWLTRCFHKFPRQIWSHLDLSTKITLSSNIIDFMS